MCIICSDWIAKYVGMCFLCWLVRNVCVMYFDWWINSISSALVLRTLESLHGHRPVVELPDQPFHPSQISLWYNPFSLDDYCRWMTEESTADFEGWKCWYKVVSSKKYRLHKDEWRPFVFALDDVWDCELEGKAEILFFVYFYRLVLLHSLHAILRRIGPWPIFCNLYEH